eukprot:PhF_6_TR4425/c0_g1_i1/m.5987
MTEVAEEETILPTSSAFIEKVGSLAQGSTSKLSALTGLLLDKLSVDDTIELSESEQRTVCKSFKVEDPYTIVRTLVFCLQQFGYYGVKSQQVTESLTAVSLPEEHIQSIASAWDEFSKPYLQRLRSDSMGGQNVLRDVAIQPQVSTSGPTGFNPSCVVQLLGSSEGGQGDVTLQLTQAQLYELFNTIDTIQSKLDTLGQ